MSVKVYAAIFGILFLLIGIAGFFPQFYFNGNLLYLFTVNLYHNIFHIVTGILGLLVAFSSYYARMYFRVFGVLYLFIAALAVMVGSDLIFAHLNHADNLFHLIIGAIFIYLGFGKPRRERYTDTHGNRVVRGEDRRRDTEDFDRVRSHEEYDTRGNRVLHEDLGESKREDVRNLENKDERPVQVDLTGSKGTTKREND